MAATPRMQTIRAERERRIVEATRTIAEQEGWAAVTIRRLADAIGYSQPVLYSHFPGGRDEIIGAVIVDGYVRLGVELAAAADRTAARGRATPADRLRAAILAYLAFARENGAVYEAMSSMPSTVVFAAERTPAELRESFEQVLAVAGGSGDEQTVRAELLWSALHGISTLDASDRLDPALEAARTDTLVALFSS